ncbi:MAG: hypothetical protein J6Q52_03645 [Clostridia bacterium]|nr:hypothetical protein [Clostridia bacterium]
MKKCVLILIITAMASGVLSACTEDSSVAIPRYDIEVDYLGDTLEIEEHIYYQHGGDTTSQLAIMLYPSAYQSVDTVGGENNTDYFEKGSVELKSVCIDGVQSEYSIGGYLDTCLTANLSQPLSYMSEIEVDICYTICLPHCDARLGITSDGVVNLSNFYAVIPSLRDGVWSIDDYVYIGDPYVSDLKDIDLSITIPSGYTLAHGGGKVERVDSEESSTYTLEYSQVRDVAVCISDKYQFSKMDIDGVEITYYYYQDTDYLNTLYVARDSLRYFVETFGEYPYDTYSVAETSLMAGGMEYSGFSLINSKLKKEDREYTVVHETAHQWWYNIVGTDNVREPWIDEGLAEYSTILYLGEIYGEEWVREQVYSTENAYMLYVDLKDKVFDDKVNSITRSIYEYNGTLDYTYLVYLKSMLMHSNLHELLGEKYLVSLRTLVRDNYMSQIDKDILINTFAKVNNRKMDIFFDAWLEGKVYVLPMAS